MQLLNRKEFKEKLLDKYEISHGLSESDIDGMISRGFIPSVINEVGNEEFNAEHLLNNEDAFDFKFQAYNKTKDFYTAQGLKDKLQLKDSSLTSLPENSLNELASRGLLKESDYYEVRKGEIYLFSPNLVYDVERLKNALEELDNQLEAEEQEELLALVDSVDEDENIEEEDTEVVKNEDEEIPDEEFFDDVYDEKKEKKKERDKKRAKEKQQREKAAAEEARKKEYEEKLKQENSPENKQEKKTDEKKSEEQGKSDSGYSDNGAKQQGSNENNKTSEDEPKNYSQGSTDEKYKTEENGQANNTQGEGNNYGKNNKPPSKSYDDYNKTSKNKEDEPAPVNKTPVDDTKPQDYGTNNYDDNNNSGGENNYNENYSSKPTLDGSKPAGEEHKDNTPGDTYSPKEGSSGENQYDNGKTKESRSEETHPENKTTEDYKPEDGGKTSDGASGNNYGEQRHEADEEKKKYEEQKAKDRKSDGEEKPTDPKIRDEDGNFIFTGTGIGKDDEPKPSSELGDSGNNLQPKDDTPHGTGNTTNEPTHKDASGESSSYSNKDTTPAPEAAPTSNQAQAPTSTPTSSGESIDKPVESSEPTAPKESGGSAPETYKVVVPLSDGSYMTFEAVSQSSAPPTDNGSQSAPTSTPTSGTTDTTPDGNNYSGGFDDKSDDTPKTSYGEKKIVEHTGNADGDKTVNKDGGYTYTGTGIGKNQLGDTPAVVVNYDDFAVRAQAVFAAKGVVLTSEGLNQIINTLNDKAGENGFTVVVSHYNEDGELQHDTIYDSKTEGNSFGEIYDGYMKHNNIDHLPEATPDAKKNDEKILNAVGVEYGGKVENNTYYPPSVPTINPLILNELQKSGVQYIEANGVAISLDSFIKATNGQFSYVEGTDGYYNAVVAQEQIKKAADDKYKSPMDFGQTNDGDVIKRAEDAVVASDRAKKEFDDYASLASIDSDPDFVPAYIRERHNLDKNNSVGSNNKIDDKPIQGFSDVKTLGSGSDYNKEQGSEGELNRERKTRTRRFGTLPNPMHVKSKPIGNGTQVNDNPPYAQIDFSNPAEVENLARKIDGKDKELAQELRSISHELNGDIAIVLAANGTVLDGSTLLSHPEMYINGKAEYAEMVAVYIESTNPENAAKIRELNRELNGDVADVYAGKNVTDGEALLREPEKFIKGRAQDAEAVAKAIEDRYPETAKKIRELSQKLNSGETATGSIFKQLGGRNDTQEVSPEELVEKAQKLLKNTDAFKGHAAELENIASKVERTRPDIAKQLREASAAVNGSVVKLFERARKAEEKVNQFFSYKYAEETKPIPPKTSQGRSGLITTDNALGITKKYRLKPLSPKNIKARIPIFIITDKDKFGRRHLTIITQNSDGTANIIWNANRKRGNVSMLGYGPDVEEFDNVLPKGELAKKHELFKKGLRGRKLYDARFIFSEKAHFALNPEWVKSTRRKRRCKRGRAEEADAQTQNAFESAQKVFEHYKKTGNTNGTSVFSVAPAESASERATPEQPMVFEGLRGRELRKEEMKDITRGVIRNLLWYTMPTQQLNQTYLGSGYQFLFGRGSGTWATAKVISSINARFELKEMNRDILGLMGPKSFTLLKTGEKLSFRSAKDRAKIAKELQERSMSLFKVDVTRLTATSLKKIIAEGKLNGKVLTADQLNLFKSALKLRGMEDGVLNDVSVYDYLQLKGIKPFNQNLSKKYAKILNGKRIEDLSYNEIINILATFKDLDPELTRALYVAKNLTHRGEDLRYLTLADGGGFEAILEAINNAACDERFAGSLNGINIKDLSNDQIKQILKRLAERDDPIAQELSNLLSETLHLRDSIKTRGKLKTRVNNIKRLKGFYGRKMLYKLKGQALGDGLNFFYSIYRTATTAMRTYRVVKRINVVLKACFKAWLHSGKSGTMRYKIVNSKFARNRRAKKQQKALEKQQKTIRKINDKIAKKKKRAAKKAEKKKNKIKKANKKIRKSKRKIGRGKKKIGRITSIRGRIKKVIKKKLEKLFNPVNMVLSAIKKKITMMFAKFIEPILPYIAIAVLCIILFIIGFQLACGFLSMGLESVYSVIYSTSNDDVSEDTGRTTSEALVYNSVELCINLDSAFKYYNEKLFSEKTSVNAVKDIMKDEGLKDELNRYYDPKENKSGNLKRFGTTLNGIQTGMYFSYYNGDGEEIGYKSNAKDIASMANAWIGEDYHAKGLYKSYVEKLWNYSHVVAYAPRKQDENTAEEIADGHTYTLGDTQNQYVYTCPSIQSGTECYENAYQYFCNKSSSNVYKGSSHDIRMDIINGVDHSTGKVDYSVNTDNGSIVSKYVIRNGIVKYNSKGCQQHKLTYHTNTNSGVWNITNVILANGIKTEASNGSWGYYPTAANANKNKIALPNGQTATIQFYSNLQPSTSTASNLPAPSGCANWTYIVTSYKDTNGNCHTVKAYYCKGCCASCEHKKTTTSSMPTMAVAYHTGTGSTTINGKTYYKTLSGCSDAKETVHHGSGANHYIGSSAGSCNNYRKVSVPHSTTTTHTGAVSSKTCNNRYLDTSQKYSVSCPLIKTDTKVSGYSMTTYIQPDGSLGLEDKHLGRVPVYTTVTITLKPLNPTSGAYKLASSDNKIEFNIPSGTNCSYTYTWFEYGGKRYYSPYISHLQTTPKEYPCYAYKCKGHTSTSYTYEYYCNGHTRCLGYLKSNPSTISVNYCDGFCPGHTVEHYCTGHVDLNVAVVTLFLNDKNSLAYLGVPKTVKSRFEEVYTREEFSIKGEEEQTLEVQKPTENAEYLYDNAFNDAKFAKFDYNKYPLPKKGILQDFTLDLKGHSVEDPGNFGNPLDTLRWNEDFISDTVNKDTDKETKTLNDVVSALFSTFSTDNVWQDRNDAFDRVVNAEMYNIKGSYVKNFTGNPDWSKHNYFEGFFKYNIRGVEDDDGYRTGTLEMKGGLPVDNGPYSRAIEATKEDWYIAYKISFPGAYNSKPNKTEIDRILKNMITTAPTEEIQNKVLRCKSTANQLLNTIGDKYEGSGLQFAKEWFVKFYDASGGTSSSKTSVQVAYDAVKNFESYSYACRCFRKMLNNVKSIKDTYGEASVDTVIKNLSVGDLIGAGDEVYIVLYNDTNARIYPEGEDASKYGIDKGHVVVATVNGAGSQGDDATYDVVHLFSFTTEYVKKKSDLFWIYKCE